MIVKTKKRKPGWARATMEILRSNDPKLYEFGKRDCFQSFMAIERAMYGSSVWEKRYSSYLNDDDARENLRSRMKARNIGDFLNRVYRQVKRERLRFGDFTVRASSNDIPHIYIYDGEKFVTYLPENTGFMRYFPKESFNHFWRI